MFVFVVRLTPSDGYWSYFLPAVGLFGFGLVLCLISTSVVGTSQATEQDAGTTAAVLNTSSQLGEALGIAIAATVLNSWVGHQVAHGTAYPDALAGGIRVAFMALLGVLALSLLNSLIGFRGLGRPSRSDKPAEAVLEDAAVLDS
jgi:ABC-type proline/glycine betaine transport system permease subunit